MAREKDNWEHRSAGMRCSTCMWFAVKTLAAGVVSPDPAVGRCKRRCPTMNGFPVVFTTDWCGDHKLNEMVCLPGKIPDGQ